MIEYGSHITAKEYNYLRQTAGFRHMRESQAEKGLEHTDYIIVARDKGEVVGVARALFDYGYAVYITDVIVIPSYQGQGIGTAMMESIFSFVKENSEQDDFIMYALLSAQGKEGFYEKLGFTKRPNEHQGAGLSKYIH